MIRLMVCFWLVSLIAAHASAMTCVDQRFNQAFQIDEYNGYTFQIGFPQNNGMAFREPTGQFYMRLPAANPMVEAYFAAWNGQLVLLNAYAPRPRIIGFCQQQMAMPRAPQIVIPNLQPSPYQVLNAPAGAIPLPAPFAPNQPGYVKPGYASEQEMLQCVQRSGGDQDDFMECAARKMFSPQQVKAYECVADSGTNDELQQCLVGTLLGQNEKRVFDQAKDCYDSNGGNWSQLPLCMAGQQFDQRTQKIIGCVEKQATSGGVSAWETAACIGGAQLNMNPEMTIAVQCAATTGGDPMSWAACTGGKLTAAELDKCLTNGVGGPDGCFGPNNTIVIALNDLGKIVDRNFSQPLANAYNNALNDVNNGPGPGNDLVRAANNAANDLTVGPGPNNEFRKMANTILPGIW